MGSTFRLGHAAFLVIALAATRAEAAPVQGPATLGAHPRTAREVVASWTGAIAGVPGGDLAAVTHGAALVTPSRPGDPLSSWTGAIPAAAATRTDPEVALAPVRASSAPRVVASWTGSIGERVE